MAATAPMVGPLVPALGNGVPDPSPSRVTAVATHTDNHHRCHTTLGGHPPFSRVNNSAGQYT